MPKASTRPIADPGEHDSRLDVPVLTVVLLELRLSFVRPRGSRNAG